MARLFLAGPMFSSADVAAQELIDQAVTAGGYTTYLAPRDGIEIRQLIEVLESPQAQSPDLLKAGLVLQKVGWCHEMYQLFNCDAVILNMNGRVPDEGSVAEAATAFAGGIPVVNFKDSSITMWGLFNNPMVAALDRTWAPVKTLAELPAAVAEALKTVPVGYTYTPPPHLVDSIDFGKYVAANRNALMAALMAAAANIPTALARYEPDLDSMRKLVAALLNQTTP